MKTVVSCSLNTFGLTMFSMKMDYSPHLGNLILQLREERGLSQAQLAEAAGVTYNYIGKLEKGRSDPSLRVLIGIAQGLGIRLSDFAMLIEKLV